MEKDLGINVLRPVTTSRSVLSIPMGSPTTSCTLLVGAETIEIASRHIHPPRGTTAACKNTVIISEKIFFTRFTSFPHQPPITQPSLPSRHPVKVLVHTQDDFEHEIGLPEKFGHVWAGWC